MNEYNDWTGMWQEALGQGGTEILELERKLRLSQKYSDMLQLLDTLDREGGDLEADVDDEVSDLVQLSFTEGGFDLALTFPGFLSAYYRKTEGFTAMMAATGFFACRVQQLAVACEIEIDVIPILTLVSRSDPRVSGGDPRGISELDVVSNGVSKASVLLGREQNMVVDCFTPSLSRRGTLLKRGIIVVYEPSTWH